MPGRRTRVTGIERLIVMAILGILMAIVLPALQQGRRRALRVQPRAPVVDDRPSEPWEGQLNTIEVPDEAAGARERAQRRAVQWVGVLVQLTILTLVVAVVLSVIRRHRRHAQQ